MHGLPSWGLGAVAYLRHALVSVPVAYSWGTVAPGSPVGVDVLPGLVVCTRPVLGCEVRFLLVAGPLTGRLPPVFTLVADLLKG